MQSRFQPGTMIVGRFRLEQPLGEGAYGEVWRAVQLPVERPVAIKLLKPSSDHFAKQRFDREARAMAAINHPNCLTFFDFGHLPGDAGSFLVSELVDGETLRDWMRQPRAVAEIVAVCQQIVAALGAAHHKQVLHRDLKPENIMVVTDHQGGHTVKVLDFGLSKIVDDERRDITKTGEIFGTPGYMSPEQLRGHEIDGATDLYSFGVILYELLEGRPPYIGPTAHETCMMHLTTPVPAVTRDVPAPLAHLATRLLTKEPRERPGSPEILRVLGAVAAGAPTMQIAPSPRPVAAPQPATVREHTTYVRKPSKAPLVFGVAGTIAALVILGVVLWPDDSPPQQLDPERVENPLAAPITNPPQRPSEDATPAVALVPDLAPEVGGTCDFEPGVTQELRGLQGWALLRRPAKADPSKPLPILVLLHEAFYQDPTWFRDKTRFFDFADEHGFAVVAPDGGSTPFQTRRDWERVWSLIQAAREELCAPEGPLFLFGYGAGGWAAENMACMFDGITATVATSHRLQRDEALCEMKTPVPHMTIWPTLDPWDPVQGGACPLGLGKDKQPLADHRSALLSRHECEDQGKSKRYGEKHECTSHSCRTRLDVCIVEAGRPWPGLERSIDPCKGGYSATDFPYDDVVWEFLMAHTPG